MRTKDGIIAAELDQLPNDNPALYSMLVTIDAYARWKFSKSIFVTSIWRLRNDPNRLHRNTQAADMRVFNHIRDGHDASKILTLDEWEQIQRWANTTFRYGKLNSNPFKSSVVLHLRIKRDGNGNLLPETHVHLQERGRRYWR